jgi:hypothetical protein
MTEFEKLLENQELPVVGWDCDPFIESKIQSFYETFSSIFSRWETKGFSSVLDVHIIDKPGFNAYVASFDDGAGIAVFKDVFANLLNVSRAVVSHGLLLPDERTEGVANDAIVIGGSLRELVEGSRKAMVGPLTDPVREEISDGVASAAIYFILLHELGHIDNGHTGWMGAQGLLPLIAERTSKPFPFTPSFERETLEWDADCYAVQHLLQVFLRPSRSTVGGRAVWVLAGDGGCFFDRLAVKKLLLAGMVTFSFLSLEEDGDVFSDLPRSHPHISLRFLNFLNTIFHVIQFRTGQSVEPYAEELYKALDGYKESIRAAFPIRSRPEEADIAPDAMREVLSKRMRIWEQNWAEMHDVLMQFCRIDAIAPKVPGVHPGFPDSEVLG